MLPAAGKLISIRRQVFVFLFLKINVRTIGTDLSSSRDGRIPNHSEVFRHHKPISMMLKPSVLHWNPKMTTNVPIDNYLFNTRILLLLSSLLLLFVVLNQISLVGKVSSRHRRQTLSQRCLDHRGCLNRIHGFMQEPTGSKKHCFIIGPP